MHKILPDGRVLAQDELATCTQLHKVTKISKI